MRLAAVLWAGTDALDAMPMKDRDIFEFSRIRMMARPPTFDTRNAMALETYFDRTARDAWERLTSDAPVSGIRATVRAGRDRMRATILSMAALPDHHWKAAARRGLRHRRARSRSGAARCRCRRDRRRHGPDRHRPRARTRRTSKIDWRSGDMLSSDDLGRFDHIVAMDSLIHYRADSTWSGAVQRLSAANRTHRIHPLHLRAADARCSTAMHAARTSSFRVAPTARPQSIPVDRKACCASS